MGKKSAINSHGVRSSNGWWKAISLQKSFGYEGCETCICRREREANYVIGIMT